MERVRLLSGHNVHIIIDISYFQLNVVLRFLKFEKNIGLNIDSSDSAPVIGRVSSGFESKYHQYLAPSVLYR